MHLMRSASDIRTTNIYGDVVMNEMARALKVVRMAVPPDTRSPSKPLHHRQESNLGHGEQIASV
jgi:hypothetical protein